MVPVTATCKEWSVGGDRRFGGVCGKPVKGEWDGTGMCGSHLAGKRRRSENAEKTERAKASKETLKARLEELVAELGTGHVGYNSYNRVIEGQYGAYDHIRLSEGEARALIARLRS